MMKYGDSEEYGNGMRERGCTGKVNESELNQAKQRLQLDIDWKVEEIPDPAIDRCLAGISSFG